MKNLISLFLALVLILSVAACGKGKFSKTETATDAGATAEQGGNEQDGSGSEPGGSGSEPGGSGENTVIPEFGEITVADTDECTIRVTGIDPDGDFGYTVKVYLENKSAEKDYSFSVDGAAVNGVRWSTLFSKTVPAGQKANEEIYSYDSDLADIIGEFTDIELEFRVVDSEDLFSDPIFSKTVHIYPLGESRAVRYEREQQATDTMLVDNDQLTVIVTGYDPEGIWGYTVKLYITNKTDARLLLGADKVAVNGFMMDPYWATSLQPGVSAFTEMSWSESQFSENGVTEVETIEMQLYAYDLNDFSAYVYEGTVTLHP